VGFVKTNQIQCLFSMCNFHVLSMFVVSELPCRSIRSAAVETTAFKTLVTIHCSGHAILQRSRAIGRRYQPTARPFLFTAVLSCSCTCSIAIAESGCFSVVQQSLFWQNGLSQSVFRASALCHEYQSRQRHSAKVWIHVDTSQTPRQRTPVNDNNHALEL